MLIVSQNKKETYILENIIVIGTVANKIKIALSNSKEITLGEYCTAERAKEIKIQIESAYINSELIKLPNIKYNQPLTSQDLAKCICFQMPKE